MKLFERQEQTPLLAEQVSHRTSKGNVGLPIIYNDGSALLAYFTVEQRKVAAALPGWLQPAFTHMGRTVVSMAFFDYRDTSVGSYLEVAIAVPVVDKGDVVPLLPERELFQPPADRHVGFHILHLPVTTEIANASGRELWGFPKFVTPIEFHVAGAQVRARVTDPDDPLQDILAFDGTLLQGITMPTFDMLLFSRRKHTYLRTQIDIHSDFAIGIGMGLKLRVGTSQHAMANTLRDLGLNNAKPFLLQYSAHFRALLHAGTTMERVGSHHDKAHAA